MTGTLKLVRRVRDEKQIALEKRWFEAHGYTVKVDGKRITATRPLKKRR